MKLVVPSCKYLESNVKSGGMVFNISMKNVQELSPIFSILEKQNRMKLNDEPKKDAKVNTN